MALSSGNAIIGECAISHRGDLGSTRRCRFSRLLGYQWGITGPGLRLLRFIHKPAIRREGAALWFLVAEFPAACRPVAIVRHVTNKLMENRKGFRVGLVSGDRLDGG